MIPRGIATSREDRREGVIATLTDGSVHHKLGSRREALRAVAVECDLRGVKVVSISTPQTIYTDLQGARWEHPRGSRVTGAMEEGPAHTQPPEPDLLGLVGRRDLAAD